MAGRMAMAILLAASGAAAAGGAERRAEVVNTQVQRRIDVSTQFAKVGLMSMLGDYARSPGRDRLRWWWICGDCSLSHTAAVYQGQSALIRWEQGPLQQTCFPRLCILDCAL